MQMTQLVLKLSILNYSESGEKKRPVIIHRAILGSVERVIAILTESYAGKWPFWLSPRQVMVIPVGPTYDDYAEHVKGKLHDAGFMTEVDTDAGDTMNKKIRNAQLAQFNFILGKEAFHEIILKVIFCILKLLEKKRRVATL